MFSWLIIPSRIGVPVASVGSVGDEVGRGIDSPGARQQRRPSRCSARRGRQCSAPRGGGSLHDRSTSDRHPGGHGEAPVNAHVSRYGPPSTRMTAPTHAEPPGPAVLR